MPRKRKRLYDVIDLYPGNLALTDIIMEKWGSIIHVNITYRYPPQEKHISISFFDVRGIEWNVQRSTHEIEEGVEAQLMTHDLGESQYQRTARFASTMVELIFSYRMMKIELEEDDSN
jgi:hypothetical protein